MIVQLEHKQGIILNHVSVMGTWTRMVRH